MDVTLCPRFEQFISFKINNATYLADHERHYRPGLPFKNSLFIFFHVKRKRPCPAYLNAVIEGDQFTPDPPSITFRNEGRLISVTNRTITANIELKFGSMQGSHNL
jgi:hypothetical protein